MKRMEPFRANRRMITAANAMISLLNAGEHGRLRRLAIFLDSILTGSTKANDLLKITEELIEP